MAVTSACEKGLAGRHHGVGPQDGFGIHQITGQVHLVDDVLFALGDIDGDVDLLVVRGDGDGRGIDIEAHVAVVHIMRSQPFQIPGELLARVAIAAAERVVPRLLAQFEQRQQLLIVKRIVADDVDVLDAAFLAFIDRHVDGDTIAGLFLDLDVDGGAVASATGIDFLNALTNGLQRGAGEDPALADIGGRHVFQNVIGLQNPVAGDVDLADRRPLEHGNEEHVAFAGHLHFLEILRLGDGSDDLRRHLITDFIADAHGQQAEHDSGGNALQAIDLNVFDHEILPVGTRCRDGGQHQGTE